MWLKSHSRQDWPNLPVRQPEDAWHILKAELHPPKEAIEKMCSQDFLPWIAANSNRTKINRKQTSEASNSAFIEEYEDIYHNGIQTEENDEIGDRQKSNYTRIILEF